MTLTHTLNKLVEGRLRGSQHSEAELCPTNNEDSLTFLGGLLSSEAFSYSVCRVRISLLKTITHCVAMVAFLSSVGGTASAQTFTVTPPPGLGPITYPPNVVNNASVINLYMASNWDAVAPPGESKEA